MIKGHTCKTTKHGRIITIPNQRRESKRIIITRWTIIIGKLEISMPMRWRYRSRLCLPRRGTSGRILCIMTPLVLQRKRTLAIRSSLEEWDSLTMPFLEEARDNIKWWVSSIRVIRWLLIISIHFKMQMYRLQG